MKREERPERQSIYTAPSKWRRLRQLGLDHDTSASAQVDSLIDYYLDEMPASRRAKILAAAALITKGTRGR